MGAIHPPQPRASVWNSFRNACAGALLGGAAGFLTRSAKNHFSLSMEKSPLLIASAVAGTFSLLGALFAKKGRVHQGIEMGLAAVTTATVGNFGFSFVKNALQLQPHHISAGLGMFSGAVMRAFPKEWLQGAGGKIPLACLAAGCQAVMHGDYFPLLKDIALSAIAGVGAQFAGLYLKNYWY